MMFDQSLSIGSERFMEALDTPLMTSGCARSNKPSVVRHLHFGRDVLIVIYAIVTLSSLSFLVIHSSLPIWKTHWAVWISLFHEKGLVNGYYATNDVYPPLTFSLLAGISKLPGDTYINFKFLQIVVSFVSVCSILAWTRNLPLSIGFLLALAPNSIIFESTDIFYTPMLIGSLIAAASRRWALFSSLYTAALLVKFQPIVIAPYVLVWLWPELRHRATWAKIFLPAAIVLAPVIATFGIGFVVAFNRAVGAQFYLSGNAYNLNWVAGAIYAVVERLEVRPDSILNVMSAHVLPAWMWTAAKALSLASYLLSIALCVMSRREPRILFLYCGFGMLSYFMLHAEVHENHLHVVIICFALLAAVCRAEIPTFVFWSVAQAVNLMTKLTEWPHALGGLDWTLYIALGNIVMFVTLYIRIIRMALQHRQECRFALKREGELAELSQPRPR